MTQTKYICLWMSIVLAGCVSTQKRNAKMFGFGVTAHRGNSSKYPENTMRAFQSAIDLKVDWMECDIQKTKDGKIVVIHDLDTKRVGDRSLSVAESTYDQLLQVDVAHYFRTQQGQSLIRCPVARIPLLEEVIELVKKNRTTRLSIQPKQDIVDEAIQIIRDHNAQSLVGFNEGSLERLIRVKELEPDIMVFYDINGASIDLNIQQAKEYGFGSVVVQHSNITSEQIQKIHEAQLEAGAWTVNDTTTMAHLLEIGVDRIYTDEPLAFYFLKMKLGILPSSNLVKKKPKGRWFGPIEEGDNFDPDVFVPSM